MSPAFNIGKIDLVKFVVQYKDSKKDLQFYIDNGGIALEARLQPGIDKMMKALQNKGYQEGKDYFWIKDNQAQHNEAAWAKRFPTAIEWIMRD